MAVSSESFIGEERISDSAAFRRGARSGTGVAHLGRIGIWGGLESEDTCSSVLEPSTLPKARRTNTEATRSPLPNGGDNEDFRGVGETELLNANSSKSDLIKWILRKAKNGIEHGQSSGLGLIILLLLAVL